MSCRLDKEGKRFELKDPGLTARKHELVRKLTGLMNDGGVSATQEQTEMYVAMHTKGHLSDRCFISVLGRDLGGGMKLECDRIIKTPFSVTPKQKQTKKPPKNPQCQFS